jgi:predicted HNH restriction endonuclease
MKYLDRLKLVAEQHAKFRETPEWQLFRKWMLSAHAQTCDFCGKKYSRTSFLDVHHKFVTNYTNLEPSRFMLLCKTCHKFLHAKEHTPLLGRYTNLKD